MYNEEALKSIYKYNMLFNNISNNNNTEEDAKYNTNLISDFDLENFDPKRYEYYTGLLKVFNNDPETLYNLLNKYNSIKSLKVKEKKIIREINDYVNKIKNINDNNPVDGTPAGAAAPAAVGGRGTYIKTVGGADESNEIKKIKSKIEKLEAEAKELIDKDGTVFASVSKFLVSIKDGDEEKFENWKEGLSEKTIINSNTRTQISIIKEAINKFKGAIAFYNENHEPMKGGIKFKELLTNSDKEKTQEEKTSRVEKDANKKLKLEEQRKHEKNVLDAEKLVLSAEKLVVQIENAITYISEKNNKVKDGLDDIFSELDKDKNDEIIKEESDRQGEIKAKNKEANLKADSAIGLLKEAVVSSISVSSKLYDVANTGSKEIEKNAKAPATAPAPAAAKATATATAAAPAAATAAATAAANSAINSLKYAVAPSISVGNELYKVAAAGSKEIERVKAKADAEAKAAETKTKATDTKATATETEAANSAINSLKYAVAPSISVGNELYKVAKVAATAAATAAETEATDVDSAEAKFIDSIKGTKLLNSISKIFDEFKGTDDLGIEKTNAAATTAATPATPATTSASQDASGVTEAIRNKRKNLRSLPPVKKVSESVIDQGGGRLSTGGNPNQKYSDDNLKAQYLDTQRYNKIKDNKIINEYRNILNKNKDKVVSIKTDNKIEQLSNDIDVYNSLDFDEKESKDETDDIIKKIRDFETDPKNPIEALELTFDDRIVFIIATFFIRYITIIMVQWCIDINIIKTFYEGFIYYAVIYIILFWFIVLFINIDNSFDVKYMNFNGIINSIRTLFYYFYMGTNGISRLLIHTSLILLLIVIPIILNIKKKPDFKDEDDQESMKILDYEERKQLSKALSLFTMFIWLFTSIIATKF